MKKKSLINRIITYALVCVTMFSCCLLAGIYAKYTSRSNNGGNADVATFVFTATTEANRTMEIDLSDIKQPGDSKKIKLNISNTSRAGQVGEVGEHYSGTIKMLGDMPIKCELTLKGEETTPAVSLDATTTTTQGSFEGNFEAGVSKTDEYELHVYWPEGKNDAEYAKGGYVAWIEIEVACEQSA